MTSKTPTASGISRLLAKAGFERAEYTGGGRYGHRNRSEGFVVRAEDGEVSVRHVFGSLAQHIDERRHQRLDQYAEAITAAGWTVGRGLWRLAVTAGEG